MANMEAATVAEIFVYNFVSRFGASGFLHTDQDRNIDSASRKAVCKLLGITKQGKLHTISIRMVS